MYALFSHANIIYQPCRPGKTITNLSKYQENTLIKTLSPAQKKASSDMKLFLALDQSIYK